MNEQQVRNIIREELASFMKQSKYVFDRPIQILDGNDIVLPQAIGTRIGTSASQKIGFFGVNPAVQPPAITVPSGGSVIDSECRTATAHIIGDLRTLGLSKTA